MAKLESTTAKVNNNKKTKGKKRKHVANDQDDEVANKSLIVEHEHDEKSPVAEHEEAQVNTAKTLKRKKKTQKSIKEKRAKRNKDSDSDGEDDGGDDDDEELHEPTLEEMRESEKPENTKNILTVRQKKKQKHKERVEAQKDQSVGKEKQRNAEYLRKWKHARDEWKFEKLRQISIQLSIFDGEKIDAEIWPIALEYLSGSKGAAKQKITKLAEDVIDKVDAECETIENEAERQALVDSTRYQRARELLQSFD